MKGVAGSPLVVIVGPTASGKSGLALRLARQYGGEVIAADSRTVFKDMTIGTAKPTTVERTEVPHWGLDLVQPGESFTAADFKDYALQKIAEIRQRGRTPFLVGGTGLYVDGVLFDYSFASPANQNRRQQLEQMTLAELQNYCHKHNIELPENSQNKRYVVRAIERQSVSIMGRQQPIDNTVIVGIATNRKQLRTRIEQRIEHMFEHGVVEEAKMLGKKYGWENQAMTGNVYDLARQVAEGSVDRSDAVHRAGQKDWRLAKRQMTWFQRNPYIFWDTPEKLAQYIAEHLNS